MKISVKMCHSQLLLMLVHPKEFSRAVYSYSASAPDMDGEGLTGCMETDVEFVVLNIELFAKLLVDAQGRSTVNRSNWYGLVRSGRMESCAI